MPIQDVIYIALVIQPQGVPPATPWTAGFKPDILTPHAFQEQD